MIAVMLICALALLGLAFWMGDTSLGGPGLIVQIVFALAGVGCLLASGIVWIAGLFA